eukprot:1949613-Rhodomonas_salina.1
MNALPMSSVKTTAPGSNKCPEVANDFMLDGHFDTRSLGPQLSTTNSWNGAVFFGTVPIGQIASCFRWAGYHSTTPVT